MIKYGLVLAIVMLVTGSLNTISAKFADQSVAYGVDGCKSFPRSFRHPFFQAVLMFMGESFCLIAFKISTAISRYQGHDTTPAAEFSPLIFLVPALCDLTATSMLYIGLTFTFASVAQMMRGAVIIFTGLLARLFLKEKFSSHNLLGMFLIVVGLLYVGCSQALPFAGLAPPSEGDAPDSTLGAIIVLVAQLIVAVQMIAEQKFIAKYDVPPLQVVGWEGVWGLMAALIANVALYWVPTFPYETKGLMDGFDKMANHSDPLCNRSDIESVINHMENSIDAIYQVSNNGVLMASCLGLIVSIAVFNWAGISITKTLNATTRMILDTLRTILVWVFGLAVGWETKNIKPVGFQLAGFALLILGTFVYKDIVVAPVLLKIERWWYTRGDRAQLVAPDMGSSLGHSIQARGGGPVYSDPSYAE